MLSVPTLPIQGTNKYLIQLDVFHELHCLNDLRKAFYPERYGESPLNGSTIDRDSIMFLHWGKLRPRLF
jgi:hypothetical protein